MKSAVMEHASAAIEAWNDACPGGGAISEAELLQAKKGKPAVWRLKLQSGPVPSVVAKRSRMVEAELEDIIYRDVLPAAQAVAPMYFGLIPASDGSTAWNLLEYIEGEDYSADNPEHRRLPGEWLGRIHAALKSCGAAASLPDVGPGYYRPMFGAIAQTLDEVRGNPAFSSADKTGLKSLRKLLSGFSETWVRIEQLSSNFAPTLVHGSFGPRNLRVSGVGAGSTLHAFDWGAAGWGVPARDVARLESNGIRGDLDAYCTRCGLAARDGSRLVALGRLFRALEHLRWIVPRLAYDWVEGPMATVSKHAAELQIVADSGELGAIGS